VEHVDLLLLHGPCKTAAAINAMWAGAEARAARPPAPDPRSRLIFEW
jgi:hypothetical protein